MARQCLILLVLLFTPTAFLPQRYGKPYTLAQNPQLLLQIRVQKTRLYFRTSDLRKMQRSVVTITDPTTNTSHVYEGVALEQLVASAGLASDGGGIEIEFGSHQRLIISGGDLDPQTKLIVIDTVDGKLLSGHAPYYVIEKCRGKPVQTITDVQCITLKSS